MIVVNREKGKKAKMKRKKKLLSERERASFAVLVCNA